MASVKALEIYSNCIEYLSKIPDANEYGDTVDPITYKKVIKTYKKDVFNEAHKWLYMLLVFHPAKDTYEYRTLFEQVVRFSNISPSEQQREVPSLRDKVLRLATEDQRLK